MNTNIILFYILFLFTILSSLMVISLSNAVHSVLFLILVFCNVAGLLLLLGAEFLSLMLIIVYVGAIAVLFLFVVMMLNIKLNYPKIQSLFILPIGFSIFIVLHSQISIYISEFNSIKFQLKELKLIPWSLENDNMNNIKIIGNVLYTDYCSLFLLCGLILLVAMIGVIVLTMHQRIGVKKQKIEIQLSRNFENVIKFNKLRR